MTDDYPTGNGDRGETDSLARIARHWVSREKIGELTSADRTALSAWLAESEANRRAHREAARLWAVAGAASRNFEISPTPRVTRRRFLQGTTVTLGAAGTASAASWVGLLPHWRAISADHRTARGEQRDLVLSSRVEVQLDAETALSAEANGEDLELTRGAAVITIGAEGDQETRPVRLHAGAGQIVAVSARYAVQHLSQGVEVACLAGALEVIAASGITLGAGQRMQYGAPGSSQPEQVEADEIASWRRGLLVFRDKALVDVVADLNRHRPGRIVLLDDAAQRRRVTGTLDLKNLDGLVAQLSAAFSLEALSLPGGIVLLS